MEKRKILFSVIIFFVGTVVGVIISVAVGAILTYVDPGLPLTGQPKTFGDIKVCIQSSQVAKGPETPTGFYEEAHKLLWMTKDDIPFLMITQDEIGKTTGLYVLKNKDEPVLCLEPLDSLGKWGRAKYSRSSGKGYPVGDVLIDINFDGQFDFKIALSKDGNLNYRSIFLDESWKKVDHCSLKKMSAVIGQTLYIFDPNNGNWGRQ